MNLGVLELGGCLRILFFRKPSRFVSYRQLLVQFLGNYIVPSKESISHEKEKENYNKNFWGDHVSKITREISKQYVVLPEKIVV